MISIIVAWANKRVIGKSNDLPWYLPADLRHFKQLTSGHTVIMGRRTFESIIKRIGKPLPDRTNIVVTRDKKYRSPGAIVAHSFEEALSRAGSGKAFVIGGAQLYKSALDCADRMYVTEVVADITGDTFFPDFDITQWQETSREGHPADDKNPYNYEFVQLERRKET